MTDLVLQSLTIIPRMKNSVGGSSVVEDRLQNAQACEPVDGQQAEDRETIAGEGAVGAIGDLRELGLPDIDPFERQAHLSLQN